MRTTRIATVLLALAPTAILGNPVPVPKAGVITSNHHGLTGSKATNHGIANRDDHNPSTKTGDPGDLCINAHATMICTPGGEDNPNWNQNTKRSKPDDSVNLEATVVEAAAKDEARDDTDPSAIWNCSYNSLRQYECTGGPDNETCVFDDGRQVSCTTSQKTAITNPANNLEARDDKNPYSSPPWVCGENDNGGVTCWSPSETCVFNWQGQKKICTPNNPDSKTASALALESRDGGDPDFTCVTDVRGVYVCTGPDVRCVIGKQGDATCSFNGPQGDAGSGNDKSDGAGKIKVNEDLLAMVLSTVAPKPKDDSDPFDANPNYSCSQISDWTWSCGPNGVGPGNPSRKVKSLDSRVSDDEHYDPGQGCNQPQGFFGGCDGKHATKREEMFVKVVKKMADDEKKDVSVGGSNAGHYDPGQGCNQPQGFFGGCDGKDGSAEKRDVVEKLVVAEGEEKNVPGQGWQPSCFFGGCNGKDTMKREEIVEVSGKLAEEDEKNDIGDGAPDENYDPGQGCNQPQGFFGGCDGK